MSTGVQLAALVLATVGSIITYFATISVEWAKSDVSGNILENQLRTVGLWTKCTQVSTGHTQCDDYDSLLLGADKSYLVGRFFSCLAILLGFISCALFLVGMSCSNLGTAEGAKKKLRVTSGIMSATGGLLILTAGIFMGVMITQHYYETTTYRQAYAYRGRRDTSDVSSGIPTVNPAPDAPEVDMSKLLSDKQISELTLEGYVSYMLQHPELSHDCGDDAKCKMAFEKGVRNNLSPGEAMVFGTGIIMAVVGGILLILAGGLMISQGCGGGDEEYDDKASSYGYQPGTGDKRNSASGHRYV